MNDRKLAFLFLMRGGHNQPELWREFLDGQANDYSVYLHAKRPRCVGDRFWRQALIKQRYATRWGDISLVKATLALMNAALADPRNDKLILLSESCVPIKPFTTVRNTLLRDQYVAGPEHPGGPLPIPSAMDRLLAGNGPCVDGERPHGMVPPGTRPG